ncbi:hypothetical protein [Lentibacillus persicus]|nr:hypothetical protein [Lentibacillus persicus]
MRYPLYFAKESARWQQQGVAFIGLDKDEKHYTYSTKYLITVEQFMDVVKQENNGLNLEIDLETVMVNGLEAFSNSWYGMILHIGEAEGYPIFTFTADSEPEITFNKPSDEYLSMIINGLKTTIGLENTEITNYLTSKPGITGNCDRKAIEKLVLNWGDRSIQI